MKKIITICGVTSFKNNEYKSAEYDYSDNLKNFMKPLKNQNYINMLSLIIDNFNDENDTKIIPIFTEDAKKSQLKVLNTEFKKEYEELFLDENLIKNEQDFFDILRIINENLSGDDEYYIDLTHGFRHIPILATIALISKNFSDNNKVKGIFFAKEIKYKEKYEIIDLKEYLEIANMAFMLENFNENYTISTTSSFTNKNFESLRKLLVDLSNHILSNSLKKIFRGRYLENIIKNIDTVLDDRLNLTFKNSLENIKNHIKYLQKLEGRSDHERLYQMSNILFQKGYLLNAITLLYESIGSCCVEIIKIISDNTKNYIEKYCNNQKNTSTYELTNNCLNIIKAANHQCGNNKNFSDDILKEVKNYINTRGGIKKIINYIENVEYLRNNLAHGNSGTKIDDVKDKLFNLLKGYKTELIFIK